MRFKDLLDRLNIEYRDSGHEHCRPGWLQLDCPGCSRGLKRFRLGYNLRHGYCNCWSCGPKRTVQVLMDLADLPYKSVKDLLTDVAPDDIPLEPEAKGVLKIPDGVGPLLPAHRRYLRGRGYDPRDLVRVWRIGGIGISPTHGWRIYIPIHHRGDVVSWTTRSISDEHGGRYRSAGAKEESVPHKSLLYGEDYCRSAVIVCEGPFDVWSVGPGAVCTFGTGFKRSQVLKLSKYPVRAVCYDGEPAAQAKAQELCDLLEPFDGETYNVVLDTKDPGEASRKDIKKIRKVVLGE